MGILRAKIKVVVWLPSSGCPEVSSNTEPTAAIAVMQQIAKQIPLFTVIGVTFFLNSLLFRWLSTYLIGWTALTANPFFCNS